MEAKIEDVNSVVSFLCAGVFRTGFGLEDERVSPFVRLRIAVKSGLKKKSESFQKFLHSLSFTRGIFMASLFLGNPL